MQGEYVDGKLTVAIEKDEGDGHEDGVPVEGDAHVLHIGHTTLESVFQSLFISVVYPWSHLDIDRPVNCENNCRYAKCFNHSQANEEQPSGFKKNHKWKVF